MGVFFAPLPAVWAAKGPEVIEPEIARQDPDFAVQGEFSGEGIWPGGEKTKVGAQVIALGNHKFRAVVLRGGLPGDGWKRGDDQISLEGELADGVTNLKGGDKISGKIAGDELSMSDAEGKQVIKLKRTARRSPTLGAKPPPGAIVLFDGKNADQFKDGKLTEMKTLQAGCTAKEQYTIARLHLEFRLSWKPAARGQGRSNSGVYLGGLPEIQVLDSFGLEGKKNECGAFYSRREPDVNMCLPPLVWQSFDVELTQASPDQNILATVRHNGVVVHKNYDTGKKEVPQRGLHLQAHGNRVQYRNIWLVEAK